MSVYEFARDDVGIVVGTEHIPSHRESDNGSSHASEGATSCGKDTVWATMSLEEVKILIICSGENNRVCPIAYRKLTSFADEFPTLCYKIVAACLNFSNTLLRKIVIV